MTKFLIRCALGAALLAILSTPALAQTVTGTIQGTVTDTSGGVLPGVDGHAHARGHRRPAHGVTNEAGLYSAPFVQIGRYAVTAALTGFGAITREGIEVGLNETRVVDFKLDPRVTDTVTVKGEPPPINLTKAEVKSSLTAQQIMDKPTLNAGSFLSLAETFPGFQENPTSGPEQPDGLVRIVDQLQQHRHARRDVPDQRRQQRRLVREPEPPGRGAVDDPGVPGSQERLLRGVRPRRRRGRAGADQVRHQQLSRRRLLYQQDSDWNARSWFQGQLTTLPPKPAGRRNQYGVHRRVPDHAEQAVRVRQRRLARGRTARTPTRATSFCRRSSTARG